VVERLVEKGGEVVALARSDESAALLESLGARPARGDVLDRTSVAEAMRGCEVVYHLAGINAFCLADSAPMFRVNVAGSRNVVEAAAAAGVGRLVYTSSAATLGEPAGSVGREDTVHRGWFLSNYERSKFEAERAVFETAERTGLDVVCVNPASVQGPGRTGGTAKLLISFLNGRLRAIVDSRLSLVDVADCTTGHVLAEERGRAGERYVLSGATLTVGEAVALLARVTGRDGRPWRLPGAAASAVSALVEAAARIRGKRAPVCRELVRTLRHGHAYDGSKAERELGVRYTPLEETIRRTILWYEQEGLIRPADS
jgi:dihydroflavonol-4-reductase